MIIIKEQDYVIIPMAFNNFCSDIESIKMTRKYDGPVSVQRILTEKEISNLQIYLSQEDKEILQVIDMKNIMTYAEREFLKFRGILDKPVAVINLNGTLGSGLEEDLGEGVIREGNNIYFNENALIKYKQKEELIRQSYAKENARIIRWMTEYIKNEEEVKPLDSSNIYCNMYVNAKHLFLQPIKYNFLIYQLIEMLEPWRGEIDALVCASRNGANIANILGWLLKLKVVYCMNVGPRFAVVTDSLEKEIRKNKKYIYIFDFICLGTEAKVLNALLGIKGAELVGGYGIANYISLDSEFTKNNVLGKMHSLVDLQKEKIPYKIAGTKEEIVNLLVKEEKENVTGLFEI